VDTAARSYLPSTLGSVGSDDRRHRPDDRRHARSDRRRHPRLELLPRELVLVELGSGNGGLVLDLSQSGAAVQTAYGLQAGESTTFSFDLPGASARIDGTATLAWVDGTGLSGGICFDQLSPPAEQVLQQWLEQQEGNQADLAPRRLRPDGMDEAYRVPPELAASLLRVSEDARLLTGAEGASVAMRRPNGHFVCEAALGAPSLIGRTMDARRGLWAECILTGAIVRCDDACGDARVDSETRQELTLGSAVLVPLFDGTSIAGVLAVFASKPNFFTAEEIQRLRRLATQWQKPAGGVPAAPATVAEPQISHIAYEAAVEPEPVSRRAWYWGSAAVLGAAGLMSVAVAAYLRTQVPIPPPPPLHWIAPAPLEAPEPAPPVQAEAAPSVPQRNPLAEGKPRSSAPQAVVRHPQELVPPPVAADLKIPPVTATDKLPELPLPAVRQPQPQRAAAESAPAPPPAAGKAPPARRPRVQAAASVVDPRRANAFIGLPSPASGSPVPYPPAALNAGKQGSVVLKGRLARDGSVTGLRVLDGEDVFAREAMAAVSHWRYPPYSPAGRPVETEIVITINFLLSP
jgi:TonB family protein